MDEETFNIQVLGTSHLGKEHSQLPNAAQEYLFTIKNKKKADFCEAYNCYTATKTVRGKKVEFTANGMEEGIPFDLERSLREFDGSIICYHDDETHFGGETLKKLEALKLGSNKKPLLLVAVQTNQIFQLQKGYTVESILSDIKDRCEELANKLKCDHQLLVLDTLEKRGTSLETFLKKVFQTRNQISNNIQMTSFSTPLTTSSAIGSINSTTEKETEPNISGSWKSHIKSF